MSITSSGADLRIHEERDFARVAARCGGLLAAGGAANAFLAPWWWRTMVAAGLPAGAVPRFLVFELAGEVVALLPLMSSGDGLTGLAGLYTCFYQPLFAAGADEWLWSRVGYATARHCRGAGVLRLDALDADAAWLPAFLAGAARGGMRAERFDHFGNWHEPQAGPQWEPYVAARPGNLRETIRRKMRRSAPADFTLVAGGPGLEAGIAAYEEVYARSWKVAEPFPDFNATLMREAAGAGALRLGLLSAEGVLVATQLWVLAGGVATVLKLAHDEAHAALSPGTVLSVRMIRHLFEVDGVTGLDFGRGDDPYKKSWTTRRRQRVGVLLANPWHPRGLAVLGWQAAGRVRRRLAGGG